MHEYLFLRIRQHTALHALHFHTAHKPKDSNRAAASSPPKVPLTTSSVTSPSKARRFCEWADLAGSPPEHDEDDAALPPDVAPGEGLG